jgi:hypothetical protein
MKVAVEFLEFCILVVPDSNHGISTRCHDVLRIYFYLRQADTEAALK